MVDPTLGGVDLEQVLFLESDKVGNILPITIPGTDSDETETIDLLGVLKNISFTALLTGTTTEIKAKITALEDLNNGNQGASVDLITDMTDTVTGKVNRVKSRWEDPTINRATVEIQFIQGI